jgi:hypothetical protein
MMDWKMKLIIITESLAVCVHAFPLLGKPKFVVFGDEVLITADERS